LNVEDVADTVDVEPDELVQVEVVISTRSGSAQGSGKVADVSL